MKYPASSEIISYLAQFVSDQKLPLIDAVLNQRTRYLTVAIENVYQPHNASAILRSGDCFGIQDIHVIEDQCTYRVNPDIALGAAQWITLQRYTSTIDCLTALKKKGYQIAAFTLQPGPNTILDALPLTQKTVLLFGAEQTGLSQIAHEMADLYVHIPMVGFTRSLNVSVSAAIALHHLTQKLYQSNYTWQLTETEKQALTIEWLVKIIPRGKKILQHFLAEK